MSKNIYNLKHKIYSTVSELFLFKWTKYRQDRNLRYKTQYNNLPQSRFEPATARRPQLQCIVQFFNETLL